MNRILQLCSIVLCTALFFFGCFGCAFWEYDSDDISHAQLVSVSGEIDVSQIVAAASIQPSVKAGRIDFSSSLVFLEEIASLSATPDLNGKFVIADVPGGSYHLIVRLSSPLAPSYKVRLNSPLQVSLSSSPPPTTVAVKAEDKADSFVKILLVDRFGNPVTAATVTLWGEIFIHQGDGVYLSPAMPVGAIGNIYVKPPPGSSLQEQTLAVATGTFVITDIPALGVTLPPDGVKNRPPSVWIRPEKYEVSGRDQLKIYSTAIDPDSDELIPTWTASVGTFTERGTHHAIWQAPDFNATATIAVTVTERSSKLPVFQAKAQAIIRVIAAKEPDPDTGGDTGTVTATSTATDNGGDTGTVTATSTATDTGGDTGTVTATSTVTDTTTDTGTDTTTDTGTDTTTDTDTNTNTGTGTGTEPEPLLLDVIGTATAQITEASVARFDADASGGFPASYSYTWSVTSGTLLSGQDTASLIWGSPSTGGNALLATVSLLVDDGTQQASKTLNILVTPLDPPTVEFSPAHGAIAFTGSAIPFSGYGTDSRNLAIPAASMTWYLDGNPWAGKSGLSSFIANPGDLTPGAHQVSLAVSDFLGYVTSATHTVTYGYTAANISSPVASGTRFDTGATINFTATPAPVSGFASFSWLLDGNVVATNVTNYSTAGIASGWHAISYYGTDSFASVSSSTIGIWVNSLPVISPITVVSPAQFASGPAGEQIFTKIGGEGINFSCSATDLEAAGNLPGAALSWYINGDPATKSIGLNFTWLVDSPASLTIRCIATDNWGYAVSTSTVIWAWDWEQYTSDIVPGNSSFYANPGPLNSGTLLNNPTAIQAIDNSTLVVADTGNNRLIKVARTNDGGLTTDGDINGAALDTISPSPFSSGLTDLSYYSGQLYTLEKNAPVSLRRVNPADLLVTETFTYPIISDNLTAPEGMVRGAGLFFVADTSVGVVRRIDSSNGFFFSESVQVTTPFKLKLNSTGTYLYVTDQAAGKLYKFPSNFDPMPQWVTNATSATDIVLTDTHILVSDVVNGKIYVHRQSDGEFVYEFGSTAANNLQNPFGMAILGNDLYIVERTNPGRITRIRSHGW